MKKYLSMLTLLIMSQSFAQSIQSTTTAVYNQDELIPGESCVWIPVDFNDSDLLKQIPDSLKGLSIQRIDLVYTTYKLNPDFDQERLNQNRKKQLQSNWTETKSDLIAWKAIGQTAATNPDQAKELFHGFVIYYRPAPTKESIENEISFMDAFLEETGSVSERKETVMKVDESSTDNLEKRGTEKKVSSSSTAYDDFTSLLYLEQDEACYDFHLLQRNCTDDEISKVVDSIRLSYGVSNYVLSKTGAEGQRIKSCSVYWAVKKDSCAGGAMYLHGMGAPTLSGTPYSWMNGGDYSVVRTVFERNASWQDALVVMDVTGSMSPYIAQTMAWLKESQKKDQIKAFVFFNDGDQTPDRVKKTGSVGGIYGIANISFSAVYDEMKGTMKKGFGGDCPENNIEATIKGIKDYPDAKEIVMVADNWATPRDLSLVSQLNKPVHVILCGAAVGVNLAYIQLAYDTGGSVHTIESDLDSKGIVAGKTLKLGNTYFTLVNGRIVKATNG